MTKCRFSGKEGNGAAIWIGNEGNGLKKETAAACDKRITIPMLGRAESLNAAVAASILMWEMTREDGREGKVQNGAVVWKGNIPFPVT